MTPPSGKVLLIGYGNPGRMDDGLGPALAAGIAALELPGVTVDSDYQLTVEDAHDAAQYDTVIFADADACGAEPFTFKRVMPAEYASFSSHSVEPDVLLGLTRDLFHAEPVAYMLAIRGYNFNEFGEVLSDKATANLEEACLFLKSILKTGSFEERNGSAGAIDCCKCA